MQITIITEEKCVGVDGVFVSLPGLDWSRFDGDKDNPWDNIRVVQFNAKRGQGHVEYKTIGTSQVARPDMTPPNWMISQADFDANFAWVLPKYEAQLEIEALMVEEASVSVPVEGIAAAQPVASTADVEALKAQLAKQAEAIQRQDDFIKSLVAESAQVVGGGE